MTQHHIETMLEALVGHQVPALVSSIARTIGGHTLQPQPALAVSVGIQDIRSHARGVLRSFPAVGKVDVYL